MSVATASAAVAVTIAATVIGHRRRTTSGTPSSSPHRPVSHAGSCGPVIGGRGDSEAAYTHTANMNAAATASRAHGTARRTSPTLTSCGDPRVVPEAVIPWDDDAIPRTAVVPPHDPDSGLTTPALPETIVVGMTVALREQRKFFCLGV